MNELKEGMYVRFKDKRKNTYIRKVIDGYKKDGMDVGLIKMLITFRMYHKKNILNTSYNIIDLIEKKDIVIDYKGNIYQVVKVWKDYVFTDKKNKYGQVITLVDYQIKKVITKEEFSSIGYEVK